MQSFKEYRKTEYQAMLDTDKNLKRWYLNAAKGSVRRYESQKAWHFLAESTRRTPMRN
jgi:hypothetical protein